MQKNPWLKHCSPSLSQIQPYKPGKSESQLIRELNIKPEKVFKLNSNESLWGASPNVQRCLSNYKKLHFYPDGNGFELKQSIAKLHNISPQCITLGNGSNEVLELIGRAFLDANTSAIISQHAFVVYHLVTLTQQAKEITVKAKNYSHDLPAMLKAIDNDTKVIFIANPNNPTGTFVPSIQIEKFLHSVPKHILVVLDEAYHEYLVPEDRVDHVKWIEKFPNLIVTRTLSKIYGLASLRLGYAISNSDLADLFNRVRAPFNTNSLAQHCGITALHDQDFIQRVTEQTLAQKMILEQGLKEIGVPHIPSRGNFICAEFKNAQNICKQLAQNGILVRPLEGYELPNHLRITVGKATDNQCLLGALSKLI